MDRSIALPGGAVFSARAALGLIALVGAVVLAVHLVFGAGGLLNRAHLPPGAVPLSQALAEPEAPPIHQRASAACFRSAPAVSAVRTDHDDVDVRFEGQTGFMTIQYLRSEDAAIRWSYAHGSAENVYDNTNWFHTPSHLTQGDVNALSRCLPLPRDSS